MNATRIKLGISRCLIGDRVRYDGMHKHDHFLTDTLGKYVEYVPVCPEVEIGLPVPREAMRLVGPVDAPRLMTQKTGIDYTERMQTWAARRVAELEKEGLCGFIFKAKSPSSGMERVKIYTSKGDPAGSGPGMFARAFLTHFPLLPCEDEARLNDIDIRENFIERIFTLHRYREVITQDLSIRSLTDFHARHKYLLLSHSEKHAREMGSLLAGAKKQPLGQIISRYETLLLEAMSRRSTIAKHINVLQHMMGFFKENLSPDEKQELREIISEYRNENAPLIVPTTLINHYARKYKAVYLLDQTYLHPHPAELKLRNHA
jgi:uncharacterized protein YbgA (DUF1722 family)/uncharacterized protein YbbK (DUF523 family)